MDNFVRKVITFSNDVFTRFFFNGKGRLLANPLGQFYLSYNLYDESSIINSGINMFPTIGKLNINKGEIQYCFVAVNQQNIIG